MPAASSHAGRNVMPKPMTSSSSGSPDITAAV